MNPFNINKDTVINGNQNNYISGQPTEALNPTRDNPCISPINLSPLGTYVDRPAVSAEIASKMQKSCGSKTLVHALAVVGLGGTGKTQLVRRYIEQHQKRYDTVLWLDVQSDATTMSSFERCCDALLIRFEQRLSRGSLHDAPAVQGLIQWLAARKQDQKWLVVLDNADNLDQLELTQIIPENAVAGSVIITSQDGKAAKLVHRAKCTRVDRMEIEEGKALLAQCLEIDLSQAHWGVMCRLEKLVHHLDGIALALDLAGARIQDDLDNKSDLPISSFEDAKVAAIDHYFLELRQHKKSVLLDPEQNAASSYKKTIWTVWETVLSSLKRSEQRDAECSIHPMQLLKLVASLGPSIVHRELFRAASQSLTAMSSGLRVDVPQWLRSLLHVSEFGTWDAYAYKQSAARLMRFNLIHGATQDRRTPRRTWADDYPLVASWPGITMHGLVRWRTKALIDDTKYETYCTILIAACCQTCNEYEDGIDFRAVMHDYMYCEGREWQSDAFTSEGLADLYATLGSTLLSMEKFSCAERFLVKARKRQSALFGESSSKSMHASIELGKLNLRRFLKQSDPMVMTDADDDFNAPLLLDAMGPEGEVRMEATSWTIDIMHVRLAGRSIRRTAETFRTAKPEDVKRKILEGIDKQHEELSGVISRHLRAIELGIKYLGHGDPILSTLRSNLAHVYSHHWDCGLEAEQLWNLMANRRHSHDALHPQTIQTMERMIRCGRDSNCTDRRAKLMEDLCITSRIVLGIDDPRTRAREAYLERQLCDCTPPPSQNMEGIRSISEWEEGAKRASLAANAWGERVFQCLEILSSLEMRSHMRDAARKALAVSGRSAKH